MTCTGGFGGIVNVTSVMSDTLAWAGEYGWVLQVFVVVLVALIYCFTRTIVWAEYHEVKEGVLLHISAIIERHGAEIAFPTRLSDPLDR